MTTDELALALERLAAETTMDHEWAPVRFDARDPAHRAAMGDLIGRGAVMAVNDRLVDQLGELIQIDNPGPPMEREAMRARVREHLGGEPPVGYGSWFYYPWSGRLVHLLPRAELRRVRTDRNRLKLTTEEQALLAEHRVGVIGLSGGATVALILAMEGVGRELRIADPDGLDLSNLNRLRAGVCDLGVNKAVLAARAIAEIDPYLHVEPFSAGVTAESLPAFLGAGGSLDVVVELCDDLAMKLRIREAARAARIPVVMGTSDRGIVDVERFDEEPGRLPFHGWLADVTPEEIEHLHPTGKVPYALRIIGPRTMSVRARATLVEVGETVSTWPQLASGVALTGAVTAEVVRRVLLGRISGSGRLCFDAESALDLEDPYEVGGVHDGLPSPRTLAPRTAPSVLRAVRGSLTLEDVRRLVGCGVLAPSAGNHQPWRFVYGGRRLRCQVDPLRAAGLLDVGELAARHAVGAAVENILLAAGAMGIAVAVEPLVDPDDPRTICDIHMQPAGGEARPNPLYTRIAQRHTNRRVGPRAPLATADGLALQSAAADLGAELALVQDVEALAGLGAVVGALHRLRVLNRRLHGEMFEALRWTAAEVEARLDGLDVNTLGLPALDVAGLRALSEWAPAEVLRSLDLGRRLELGPRRAVGASAAVGLLRVRGTGPIADLAGGRALERVWLRATALGLAFQPLSNALYLFACAERGEPSPFSDAELLRLATLRKRLRDIFPSEAGCSEIALVRIAHAPPVEVRSLRRPLEDVLHFEPR